MHLAPAASHPLVTGLGEPAVHELLVQQLYGYLHFTVELEETAVVPVASGLGRGVVSLDLPQDMRIDAFAIATDEAYHSLSTYELMTQVSGSTGIVPLLPAAPPFLRELRSVTGPVAPERQELTRLLFAIVSETLVSGVLSDLPRHEPLPAAVRDVVRDHADDEGRHHVYFRALLRRIWPQLDPVTRGRLGVLVPRLVTGFLAPDADHERALLRQLGLTARQAAQAVAESHPPDVVRARVAAAARPTVRYFEEVGALDDAEVSDAFADAGLVPATTSRPAAR